MKNAVLVVEDEQNVAELLKERLEEEGYDAEIAYTGTEAVKDIKSHKPDVITLDIYLPDKNGLNVLRDIKSDPGTARIPVIIISSSDEGESAKDLGAEDFIKKPINFKKLFMVLEGIKSKNK
ncbi:MAG: response regulator [Endomicrobiales bacterium]|nr:response regulator [Endomicrobiales bacterium]